MAQSVTVKTESPVSPSEAMALPKAAWDQEYVLVLLAVVGLVYAILRFGDVQFGGLDGSDAANVAWQGFIGLKPYRDIVTAYPPIFFMGGRLAYLLFGVRWHALVLMAALFSGASFVVQWHLLRRLPLGLGWRFLAAMVTQALTTVEIGWWWYNHVTSTIAALFMTAALGLVMGRADRAGWRWFTGLLLLLFLAKVNTALSLSLSVVAILALRREFWLPLAKSVGIAVVGAIAVLLIFSINPLDLADSYWHAHGRFSLAKILPAAYSVIGVGDVARTFFFRISVATILGSWLLALAVGVSNRVWLRGNFLLLALNGAGFVVAVLALATNSEFASVDLPVWLMVVIALLGGALPPAQQSIKKAMEIGVLGGGALLCSIGLMQGEERLRIFTIGPGMFFEPSGLKVIEEPGYFEGVTTGPRFKAVLADIATVLDKTHLANNPDAAVYFGPRMGFGYAAFNIHNRPSRIPLTWSAYGEMDDKVAADGIESFKQSRFAVCIFLKDDYTFMPPDVIKYLYDHYTVVETGVLTVHISKEMALPPGATSAPPATAPARREIFHSGVVMNVIILCGGLGTRIRDVSEVLPKPMVPIGPYPILWHIMKHYSHYGLKDFVLCLGYKKEVVIDFFANYAARANDVTITLGAKPVVTIHQPDPAEEWRITLTDTGLKTMTGGRVKRAMKYIKGDQFLLTYGDGVSNVDINKLMESHKKSGKLATITGVHPTGRWGEIILDGASVQSFVEKPQITDGYINGGFMVLERAFVERYIADDVHSILEGEALPRCAADGQLNAYLHDDFWQCMDTPREYQLLNDLWEKDPPWKVW